jgi:hypothetical protein
MPTAAECRTKARELNVLAQRQPEHREQLLTDAAAWLILARRTDETESQDDPTPEKSSS